MTVFQEVCIDSNLTILVSLSFAEDVLPNDVKIRETFFGLQDTENPTVPLLWDTRYPVLR